MRPKLFIGLMSGTSLDGIDCVLVEFKPHSLSLIATYSCPYPKALRQDLLTLCQEKVCSLQALGELHTKLGERYAEAILALMHQAQVRPQDITAIGNHGQTIYHSPSAPHPFTLQIGNQHVVAARTGILTVGDFRSLDMAYGGQGAPLVPAFHAEYFKLDQQASVVVNIGGISNITILNDQPTVGFDTGPGNVLMDAWIQLKRKQAYDKDGEWAASGTVNTTLLHTLLQDPYFSLPAPKSTGREHFNLAWLARHLTHFSEIKDEDVQATLLALTAECIYLGIEQQNAQPHTLYICGGGALNQTLMHRLASLKPHLKVHSTAALGIHPSWVEAIAFAWLAKQAVEHKAINLTAVTGATQDCSLGVLYHP